MARRASINRIKVHRTYTVQEAADCVGVTPQTIRRWAGQGLRIMAQSKPFLILGADLKSFVRDMRAPKRGPIPKGAFRCLSCNYTGPPALGILDYDPLSDRHGMLRGFCSQCEGAVTKIVSASALPVWSEGADIAEGIETHA